ncbi:MAG: hypothetical protein KBT02_07165 [Treponema sp.]|nr:hypothetical protein [Candidatus Treponema caballi]
MSDNEKQWEKAGQILVVVILLSFAVEIGVIIGEYRENRNKGKAAESLAHALEVIEMVEVDDLEDVCQSFDTVMDDIHDALGWMGCKE